MSLFCSAGRQAKKKQKQKTKQDTHTHTHTHAQTRKYDKMTTLLCRIFQWNILAAIEQEHPITCQAFIRDTVTKHYSEEKEV
jgi:hypothetical protein